MTFYVELALDNISTYALQLLKIGFINFRYKKKCFDKHLPVTRNSSSISAEMFVNGDASWKSDT